MKTCSLVEVQDKLIGKIGTPRRDEFEFDLKLDLIGEMIQTGQKQENCKKKT